MAPSIAQPPVSLRSQICRRLIRKQVISKKTATPQSKAKRANTAVNPATYYPHNSLVGLPKELKVMIAKELQKRNHFVALSALRKTHSLFHSIIKPTSLTKLPTRKRRGEFKRAEKHLPELFSAGPPPVFFPFGFPLGQFPCYVCKRVKKAFHFYRDVRGGFKGALMGRYLHIGDEDCQYRGCDECHFRWEGTEGGFLTEKEERRYDRYREIVTRPEDL